MDTQLLQKVGLNKTQAKAYLELIRSGELTPSSLAEKIKESRTNTYMVLDQLESLDLAIKIAKLRKTFYRANNPTNLERLSGEKRKDILETEALLKASMPKLLTYFYTFSEEPGVHFYQGKDDLIKIYEDHLRSKKDLYFIRTQEDWRFFSKEFFDKYVEKRAKLGIKTEAITQYTLEAKKRVPRDKERGIKRVWMPADAYTAPVEVDIYGDKVSFISFGEEAIGTVIESPQIAQSMRQIFSLAKIGARKLSDEAKIDSASDK